ncbi:RNA polymerase sigma factor [Roseibium sp.]|uniref:RNA polymerase sigma factor n=1 Tax=Roseibium sp. TaxID=1936156 RepID=UPI003A981F04
MSGAGDMEKNGEVAMLAGSTDVAEAGGQSRAGGGSQDLPSAGIWMSWIDDALVLRRRALRLTKGNREDAEDLLSSTLVKAVAHVERHETEVREPRAFLLFAMKNEHISRLRRHNSERQVRDFKADVYQDYVSDLADRHPDQENLLRHQDALRRVLRAVDGLSPEFRQIFRLRFYDEQSYRDIARQMCISEPLARKRVQHLREQLRVALGEDLGSAARSGEDEEKSFHGRPDEASLRLTGRAYEHDPCGRGRSNAYRPPRPDRKRAWSTQSMHRSPMR